MKTAKEYIGITREMNFEIYLSGEQVKNHEHQPVVRLTRNCAAATFKPAEKPEYEPWINSISHHGNHAFRKRP